MIEIKLIGLIQLCFSFGRRKIMVEIRKEQPEDIPIIRIINERDVSRPPKTKPLGDPASKSRTLVSFFAGHDGGGH